MGNADSKRQTRRNGSSPEILDNPADVMLPAAVSARRPLGVAATNKRADAALHASLERFGFSSASYFVTRERAGVLSGEMLWTTLPSSWVAHYNREAFLALDPRLALARQSLGPVTWDAARFGGDWRIQSFLRSAAVVGIGSGVIVTLHGGGTDRVMVTFDSPLTPVSEVRAQEIGDSVGNLTVLAIKLHETMLKWRVEQKKPRRQSQSALTLRECDCLAFAARGLTSADIGYKLSVTERTVNFHFANIKSKLGAMNRPEAIARGIAMGIVAND